LHREIAAIVTRKMQGAQVMRSGGKALLVAFLLCTAASVASAQQADQTNFLADAIRGNVAEVKLGQLAAERAQSQKVREYGEMLRKDHTQTLQKASSLANQIGVPAASELSDRAQKQFESLQKLSGDEFDTTFLSQMVRDHQEDIAKFSTQAQTGSEPEVTAFAKETLPTLQAHLQHAQSIQSELTSAAHNARTHDSSPSDPPASEPPSSHSPEPFGSQAPGSRTRPPRDADTDGGR
jgi:putative membrane protein